MMQMFGGSVQAPMNAFRLSCRMSRSSFSSFFISRVMSMLFFFTFLIANPSRIKHPGDRECRKAPFSKEILTGMRSTVGELKRPIGTSPYRLDAFALGTGFRARMV
uniref:Uncharacterized protein n=1 Tax=Anopheles atroparvus TaxID=41427 RepID=A0A182IWE8_ANOAO